jgi:phage terminase large subunit-like protein
MSLPVDPYVFGYWLGDGTSACAAVTCAEEDTSHVVEHMAVEGSVVVRRYGYRSPTIGIKGGLQKKLRLMGVLGNKHVPEFYFDAGTEQRRALLQGLMDSDGTVARHAGKTTARCTFSNTSENLAYAVWRLARSLGLKATIRERRAILKGKDCGPYWQASFSATRDDGVFRMKRKDAFLPETLKKRSFTLSVVAVDKAPTVPTKCLMVDAPDSLFLVGHGCVPTHNTAFSAMVILLHLCGPEARRNSSLYSSALSRDQAAILYHLAAKMVRLNEDLSGAVATRDTVKQLYCDGLGTLYTALSADASTNFGLSPVLIVHDELGQVKGPRHPLYEALETATAAQEDPLSIIISTQSPQDADLLAVLVDDALDGHDPRTKVFLYTADMDADPFDVDTIRQANPAFDEFMNQEEVLNMAKDAERMPSREAEYRNLILNQRVEASNPFVTRSVWLENGDAPGNLGRVYGGLDLSTTSDLTALVLVSLVDDFWHVKPVFWLPGDGLAERSRADRVPYDLWHEQGFLQTTPGRSVQYKFVAEYLAKLFETGEVVKIAFDRWNMRHLKPWLIEAGMSDALVEERFSDFGQGYVSMSPALRTLEEILLDKGMKHGNHPVLSMCAANAVIEMDAAGNRKLSKKKSSGRIDGMVSLSMAVATANEELHSAPVYPVAVEHFVEDLRG